MNLLPDSWRWSAGPDLFVKVGSGIEFELEWADKIIEMNEEMEVVDCSIGYRAY